MMLLNTCLENLVHAAVGEVVCRKLVLIYPFLRIHSHAQGAICMLSFGFPVILGGLVKVPEGLPIQGCLMTAFPHFYNLCWCVVPNKSTVADP